MAEKNDRLRVRFAPSPTGWLHIGNARTALYNWLLARHHGGAMILRIEDTDIERSTTQSESGILDSLLWLGLDWDEGPDIGGDYGPYRQSERLEIYRKYADTLLEKNLAYYCFCSPEQLEDDRKASLARGEQPKYSGRCLALNPQEVGERLSREPAALRFRVPSREVVIEDGVRGKIIFPGGEFGDFVIIRSNGLPSYNFAVVIDDHLMAVTDVIRGEDHLSNTPKQLFLYEALGLAPPRFAHLPMILGPDHTRLSKRHGATSVAQFRDMGLLPEALLNYLALLGWSPGDDREIMDRDNLVRSFSLGRVSKSASIFDAGKLEWMNGSYIRQMPLEDLLVLSRPFLEEAGLLIETEKERLLASIDLIRSKAHFLKVLPGLVRPYLEKKIGFSGEALDTLGGKRAPGLLSAMIEALENDPPASREEFQELLKNIGRELGLKGKDLFMPMRAALIGEIHGPELDRIYMFFGPEITLLRLKEALESIKTSGDQ